MRQFQAAFQPQLDDPTHGSIFLDADPYYWITYAREMVETGSWRIRHTAVDNAPFGRPVYWSEAFTWLLVLFGAVRHFFTGLPMGDAIAMASIWVNPFLQALLVLGLGGIVARRLGLLAGLLCGAWLLTLGDIFWAFHPLRPDHQSLHCIFAVGSLFLLLFAGLGWVTPRGVSPSGESIWIKELHVPTYGEARGYFVLAGVVGGLGLWAGATVQFICLAGISGICFWLIFFMPHSPEREELQFHPRLWRLWAVAGAATSVVFYLVEFFPSHISMRLEVVHPWYAIVWLGMGELLAGVASVRIQKARPSALRIVWLAGCALVALSLPLALAIGPAAWHNLRNSEMLGLHAYIAEFHSYFSVYGGRALPTFFGNFLSLPLFIIAGIFLGISPRLRLAEWSAVWLATLSTLFFFLLSLQQVRWLGIFGAVNVLLMLVVIFVGLSVLRRDVVVPNSWWKAALVIMFFQPAFMAVRNLSQANLSIESKAASDFFVKPVMDKRFALRLAREMNGASPVVMGDPGMASTLFYFAQARAIPSYYWENIDGLSAAADFFSGTSDSAAREIANERQIKYIMVDQSMQLADKMLSLRTGRKSSADLEKSLAGRLAQRSLDVPKWLTMDYELANRLQPAESVGSANLRGNRTVWRVSQ